MNRGDRGNGIGIGIDSSIYSGNSTTQVSLIHWVCEWAHFGEITQGIAAYVHYVLCIMHYQLSTYKMVASATRTRSPCI